MPKLDLTGQTYGRLLVTGYARTAGGQPYWHCLCSCGTEKDVQGAALRSGGTTSCGCARSERASKMNLARRIDLSGQRFGRLTAVTPLPANGTNGTPWECRCDCGTLTVVPSGRLRTGRTRSCGCLWRDALRLHGYTGSPTYNSWASMMSRTANPRDAHYPKYGGKGIRTCPAWHDFRVFLSDMGERPDGTSLDRIDGTRGYEPGNCRWATPLQQARNTSHVKLTPAMINEILALHRQGLGVKDISRAVGYFASGVGIVIATAEALAEKHH